MTSDLTDMKKLVLIGQLYASQLQGMFVMKGKNVRNTYFGRVTKISSKEITIKTADKYQLLQVKDILSINMTEETDFEIYEGKLQIDYFSDSYLKFEEDFYRYSALGEPLTTLTDDILRAMAMGQRNYFKLSKRHSKDGRDHYFYFTVEFSKTEVGVRKFEYKQHVYHQLSKISE